MTVAPDRANGDHVRPVQETRLDLGRHLPEETAPGLGRWRWEKSLPLETDGRLRVIALGTGSTQASLRMAELGIPLAAVEHVVVTHSHADHIGCLEELAARRRYELPLRAMPRRAGEDEDAYAARLADARRAGRFRPKLHIPGFYAKELWEASLRGGLMHCEEVPDKGPEGAMRLEHFFEVVEPEERPGDIPSWRCVIGGIEVVTFKTVHAPDRAGPGTPRMHSVGLVVDGRLFISGDTQFDPRPLKVFGKGCEALFHEAQHFAGGVHTFYEDLRALPADLRKRMYLYHLPEGMLSLEPREDGFAGFVKPAPWVYDF